MKQEHTFRILSSLPAIIFVVSLVVPPALAESSGLAVGTTSSVEPPPLARLAAAFGEAGGSTGSSQAHCGTQGHCNFVSCPDPGCGIDEDPVYECKASQFRCSDDHSWDPFDNDEHAVYDCSSTCRPERPEPQECTIRNPVGSGCLLDERCVPDLALMPMKHEIGASGSPGC